MTEPDSRMLLRPEEAAGRLGISRAYLYRLIERGDIRSIVLGVKSRRIVVADLEAYIQRKQAEQTQPNGNLRRLRRGAA